MDTTGFSGIPVSVRSIKRPVNEEVSKQWRDLDKKKKEAREEKKLRDVRKRKRPVNVKVKPVKIQRTTKK